VQAPDTRYYRPQNDRTAGIGTPIPGLMVWRSG